MEIEVHLDAKEYGGKERTYKSLLKAFKDFNKMGFRLAAYNPNLCQDTRKEVDQRYHNYFDVLFVNKP